ncbi:hypothetical protein KDD30_22840 (plasmid) [Photobacterium sp. GJ3]|uniref:hypothetical protein n=1 Tax=Photobacterium sp. GJ3 TaxID=2829502 RepID=UPI001B8B88C4|nr:hypothetical protein [Photobacterium sp. GJ3]QUJ69583.1 hypothetical protein KDD30_22840 [Photobacterium sp. GJ3]
MPKKYQIIGLLHFYTKFQHLRTWINEKNAMVETERDVIVFICWGGLNVTGMKKTEVSVCFFGELVGDCVVLD